MNMVRIRHIIAIRKALKADPLLPPISKSREKPSGDGTYDKKSAPKDIIEIDLQIRELKVDLFTFEDIVCLISENESGPDGPWKVVTTTEVIPKADAISIPNAFSIEYTFERDQFLRLEICDYSEQEVTVIGAATFFITEVVTSSPNLSINLMKSLLSCQKQPQNEANVSTTDDEEHLKKTVLQKCPCSQGESGKCVAAMTISYTVRPKEQPVLLQFCGRNLPRKGMLENTQVYFQMYRIEENRESSLLYKSEYLLYSLKLLWRPFKLLKNVISDSKNRCFEVVCYSRDDHAKCSVIGQFTTTSDMLLSNAEERSAFTLQSGPKSDKKTSGTFEVVRCYEITVYSFLDYITTGYCLAFAVGVDFSITDPEDMNATFASDVEFVIRSICEPFRRHNFSQSYAAFGFGARIPPQFRESQQFCLNLETDPNCQGIDGLIDAFRKANDQVQPSTSARFAHIIYHLSKLAVNARKRENQLRFQYFVLAIISRGKINDIRETVQATIFASRTPVSIVFIATEDGCEEMERLGLSAGRLSYQNRRAERDMLQFVSLKKIRSKSAEEANFGEVFAERALRRVPWQMNNWLTKNGYTPHQFVQRDSLSKQDSSGTSTLGSKKQQQGFLATPPFGSDHSVEDLDQADCASTSDCYDIEGHQGFAETEDIAKASFSAMPTQILEQSPQNRSLRTSPVRSAFAAFRSMSVQSSPADYSDSTVQQCVGRSHRRSHHTTVNDRYGGT